MFSNEGEDPTQTMNAKLFESCMSQLTYALPQQGPNSAQNPMVPNAD
jgi:hypothetical protein